MRKEGEEYRERPREQTSVFRKKKSAKLPNLKIKGHNCSLHYERLLRGEGA